MSSLKVGKLKRPKWKSSDFERRIRYLRTACGYSLSEIALGLGCGEPYLRRVLSGRYELSLNLAKSMSELLLRKSKEVLDDIKEDGSLTDEEVTYYESLGDLLEALSDGVE